MYPERLRAALVVSWLAASTLLFPALLLASLLPQQSLLALAPGGGQHIRGRRDCALCGMAGGLLLITQGELNAAADRSAASIPVYSALVWNECVAVWYALGEVGRAVTGSRRKSARVQAEESSCRS